MRCFRIHRNTFEFETIYTMKETVISPNLWFPKSYMSKDKPLHPHFLPKGQSFSSSNQLLISSLFQTFLHNFKSCPSLFLSRFFFFFLKISEHGQRTLAGWDPKRNDERFFSFLLLSQFLGVNYWFLAKYLKLRNNRKYIGKDRDYNRKLSEIIGK